MDEKLTCFTKQNFKKLVFRLRKYIKILENRKRSAQKMSSIAKITI